MKTIKIGALLLIGALLGGTAFAGSIIPNTIAIPDSEVLINFNGTGLDWVYAGPIAPDEFGPGNIESPGYRAAEGWRFATLADWALRPDWDDFTRIGFTVPAVASWSDHSQYRFASEYWGFFSHVDLNDAADGLITNGLDIGSLTGVWETFYVRDTRSVPDTGATALLCVMAFAAMVGYRRRQNA